MLTEFVHPSIQSLVRVSLLAYQQKKLPSAIKREDNRDIEALEIVISTIKAQERRQQQNG